MTAKRFNFICDDEKCFFKDGNKALYCYEVVDLLNSLSDENEQLKSENKKLNERIGILEGSLIDKGFDIND